MVCTNYTLAIASIVILALTFWPDMLSATAGKWVIIVAAAAILILSFTGVKCKFCEDKKKK
jgi:hypothetical protein